MVAFLSDTTSRIARTRQAGPEDVISIRRAIYPDGLISLEEADWLFELNALIDTPGEDWRRLFSEAITDFTVYQAEPRGYVTKDKVDWLIGQIMQDGHVDPATELEVVINVLEKAIRAPDELAAFALGKVKDHVLRANRMSGTEVTLLRRILYAAGGQQAIAVTRKEAEVLYDIDDARAGQEDDSAWLDLFSKALLNHLMFASGFAPPTREEALAREAWLHDTIVDPASFLTRMAQGLGSIISAYRQPDFETEYEYRREAIQAEAEQITDEEAAWLVARLERDGKLSQAERALIAALRTEQPRLHPLIQAAIDRLS